MRSQREFDELSPDEVGSQQRIARSKLQIQREVDEVSPEAGSQQQNARKKTSKAKRWPSKVTRARPARRLAVDVEVDKK